MFNVFLENSQEKSESDHSLFGGAILYSRNQTMLYDKKKREFTKILNGLKKAENKDFAEIKRLENLLEEMKKI